MKYRKSDAYERITRTSSVNAIDAMRDENDEDETEGSGDGNEEEEVTPSKEKSKGKLLSRPYKLLRAFTTGFSSKNK